MKKEDGVPPHKSSVFKKTFGKRGCIEGPHCHHICHPSISFCEDTLKVKSISHNQPPYKIRVKEFSTISVEKVRKYLLLFLFIYYLSRVGTLKKNNY